MDVCSVPECGRKHWGRGFCQGHLTRVQRYGDPQVDRPLMVKTPNGPICSIDGCGRKPHAHQLCSGHLTRLTKHGDVLAHVPVSPAKVEGCSVDGCERNHSAHGYCRLHGRRVATHGTIDLPVREIRMCAAPSCGRSAVARGYCNTHNERLRLRGSLDLDRPVKVLRPDRPCDLDGCDRPHYCLGFCVNHYQQRVSKPRRKALEDAALGDVTADQLQARIDYYGGRCWMCRAAWTCIDHVKPLAAGGTNWPANLRPACTSCNATKSGRWPYPTSTRKAA